ncbi:hypothetical protein ACH5BF_08740 [Arcobacter sp. YIC-464]|uniref:hypothetical protein n=1 Tax=Arcobacter sp. YIC-464 TaxID=3376631 RepID=UPI003C1E6C27
MKQSNSTNMKSSFSLLELILVTLISSIVIVYSLVFIKELYHNNEIIEKQEISKIDLLATKAFLEKKADFYNHIKYENKTLFYKDSILLENVTNFSMKKKDMFIYIKLNFQDEVLIEWVFKI